MSLNSKKINIYLLKELVIRDVSSRYKGATLGIIWLALVPTLTLLVYATIFKYIFKAKWTGIDADFYVILFSGLTFFGLLGDVINRAPAIITSNPNYIKKVIFPSELLPIMVASSSLVSFFATYAILIFFTAFSGNLSWGCLFALIVVPPYFFLAAGVSMVISAAGVFYKDLQHFSTFITMLLMYSSTVFYPITAVPEQFRNILYANPITLPIEIFRELYFHSYINWSDYLKFSAASLAVYAFGALFFKRVKGAFADEI